MTARFDAILLAGGRGSRMGGVCKPELTVGGSRLVDLALSSVAGAASVIVVGDARVPPGVNHTREDPAYGGPVAALDAGFQALETHSEWTVVLATDLPDVVAAVARLLRAPVPADQDGACLLDTDGRLQWLLGRYRTPALAARLADRGEPPITAMHRLLRPLRLHGVDPGAASVADVDTPDELRRWQQPQDQSPDQR